MTTTSEAETVLNVPLRSDPRWLTAGVALVTLGCSLVFVAIFSKSELGSALGLIPGITFAVFLGSALAAWGRQRGGTLALRLSPYRMEVCDPDERHEWLNLTAPYAAVLLIDPKAGQRMLIVGQNGDPLTVLETGVIAPTDAPLQGLADGWKARTLVLDLHDFAVSPASANTVALALGQRLDPILDRLAGSLSEATPWLVQPTASGEVLKLAPDEVRFGAQAVPLGANVKAIPYTLQAQGATVAALGVSVGEGALVLLGCEEAPIESGAVTGNLTPDAYVPLPAYELLRAVVQSRGEPARG